MSSAAALSAPLHAFTSSSRRPHGSSPPSLCVLSGFELAACGVVVLISTNVSVATKGSAQIQLIKVQPSKEANLDGGTLISWI